jgi:hypothetical protein
MSFFLQCISPLIRAISLARTLREMVLKAAPTSLATIQDLPTPRPAMPKGAVTTMVSPTNVDGYPTTQGLSGVAHRRFVVVTTLLSLIDPVRGEPTVHSLDTHPHDSSWTPLQSQKKFLDSFALICSTSRKGADTASAVCLEQDHPNGPILRLARNTGTPAGIVSQLQLVLADLKSVAARG